jgi:YbgC/YbaW family acyl-CoA thioester hydrolase
MSKLTLIFPEADKVFTCQLVVRATDLNYGGHLANDAVLRLIQEARVQFLHTLGGNEVNIHGVGVILADVQLMFKAEAFYQDVLIVDIAIAQWRKCECAFYYRLTREKDAKLITLAKIRTVFFDYTQRKIKPIPEQLKQQIHHLLRSRQ